MEPMTRQAYIDKALSAVDEGSLSHEVKRQITRALDALNEQGWITYEKED